MSIVVTCSCKQTYRLPDRYAGKKAKCRECGKAIAVPAAAKVGSEARRGGSRSAEASDKKADAPRKEKKRAKTTRRLNSQDREIIGDRRELRRSHRTPVTSESIHQLAPMPLSGDALDVPARTPKPAIKRPKGGGEAEGKKVKGKSKPTKKKGKAEVEAKKKKKTDASRKAADDDEDEVVDKKKKSSSEKEKGEKKKPKRKLSESAAMRNRGKAAGARRSSREDDGEEGDEDAELEAPKKVNLTVIVAIAGVLCLGVGLVVGLVMRSGRLNPAEVSARISRIEELYTDRQWPAAKAESEKLTAELKATEHDIPALNRSIVVNNAVGLMNTLLDIKDRDARVATLIKYTNPDKSPIVRVGICRELAEFAGEDDVRTCLERLAKDSDKKVAAAASEALARAGPASTPAPAAAPPAAPAGEAPKTDEAPKTE